MSQDKDNKTNVETKSEGLINLSLSPEVANNNHGLLDKLLNAQIDAGTRPCPVCGGEVVPVDIGEKVIRLVGRKPVSVEHIKEIECEACGYQGLTEISVQRMKIALAETKIRSVREHHVRLIRAQYTSCTFDTILGILEAAFLQCAQEVNDAQSGSMSGSEIPRLMRSLRAQVQSFDLPEEKEVYEYEEPSGEAGADDIPF